MIGIIGSHGRNDWSVLSGRTEGNDGLISRLTTPPPQFSVGEMLVINFVKKSVSGLYFVSVPYSRTGGNMISTCFSIVCAPKSQLSSYPAWEKFNITMDIGGTERTRVPLES